MVFQDHTYKGSSKLELQDRSKDLSVFGVRKARFEDFVHFQGKFGEKEDGQVRLKLQDFRESNDIEIHFDNLENTFSNENVFFVDNGIVFKKNNF